MRDQIGNQTEFLSFVNINITVVGENKIADVSNS